MKSALLRKVACAIFIFSIIVIVSGCKNSSSESNPHTPEDTDATITGVQNPGQVKTPRFESAPGLYVQSKRIKITCETPEARIYYTTDNSAPDTSSLVYTQEITITESTTIKAIAINDSMKNSTVATAVYNILHDISIENLVVTDTGTGTAEISFDIISNEAVEISADFYTAFTSDKNWHKASIGTMPKTFNATPEGSRYNLTWNIKKDLGIHKPEAVTIKSTFYIQGEEFTSVETAYNETSTYNTYVYQNRKTHVQSLADYMIYYGSLNNTVIEKAKQYPLVILHPQHGNINRNDIRKIQQGVDPSDPADDVLVIGYISVGEDLRTYNMTPEQMLADSRFTADGSGPRVDPRTGAPFDDGAPFDSTIDAAGITSPGGSGFAPYYLDDNDYNGIPDRNSEWGQCFVNAGHPLWFETVNNMTIDGIDGIPGLREMLTHEYGRSLGLDGVFLDTIDTSAPNSYTDADTAISGGVRTEFEWTAPGFSKFVSRLRENYPHSVIVQNRGLFYFRPEHTSHYAVSTRKDIDALLYESYRLNNSNSIAYLENDFLNNSYNVAPRVIAESQRNDGFRVLSLGYAEGPGINANTLTGAANQGLATLTTDMSEATQKGFIHYITDRNITLINDFASIFTNTVQTGDNNAPVWGSTYNDSFENPATEYPGNKPSPRVGVQKITTASDSATVHWDVAFDISGVTYYLYYQDTMFDFSTDPDLSNAQKIKLVPETGAGYGEGLHWQGSAPDIYPFQYTITGLDSGRNYFFLIRASDNHGNEDTNEVVLYQTIL